MAWSLTVTNCAKQIASIIDIDNFTDYFPPSTDMRAPVLRKPGHADLETVADPVLTDTNVLLKVRFVGFCGSDLNSFRGLNPLVTYPRILGHEIAATVLQDLGREAILSAGTNVRSLHTPAAGNALPVCADVRTLASSTRLSVCKGTAH